jgi:hypothetical protein
MVELNDHAAQTTPPFLLGDEGCGLSRCLEGPSLIGDSSVLKDLSKRPAAGDTRRSTKLGGLPRGSIVAIQRPRQVRAPIFLNIHLQ